jgi:hypothetical protein
MKALVVQHLELAALSSSGLAALDYFAWDLLELAALLALNSFEAAADIDWAVQQALFVVGELIAVEESKVVGVFVALSSSCRPFLEVV